MDDEPLVFSLIVKVTIEGAATGSRRWHGQVTHVPSGRQVYFTGTRELRDILKDYLREEGIVQRRKRWWQRGLSWLRGRSS
jgi:hypothetical protein